MLYTKSDKIQQYTLGRKGGSNTGNLADNLMEDLDHHGSACDSIHYPGKKLKG